MCFCDLVAQLVSAEQPPLPGCCLVHPFTYRGHYKQNHHGKHSCAGIVHKHVFSAHLVPNMLSINVELFRNVFPVIQEGRNSEGTLSFLV